jgi:Gnt-I system high-affinity gluconate transporter
MYFFIILVCIILLIILKTQFKIDTLRAVMIVIMISSFLVSYKIQSTLLTIIVCIASLILLITQFNVNAFLSFLIISIIAGLLLGISVDAITASLQKGIGDMLGSLVIVVVCGAMLGKLAADSGAARQIASGLMRTFGKKYIQWALVLTGFIIGIPLFYNVGFVLVVPLIFSVAYEYKFPTVYIGLPMLAALSVTHGFLPPHPSPTALVGQFHADMGTTLFYGVLIGIPTVILAGPLFSKTLRRINPPVPETFVAEALPSKLPGLSTSVISCLLPVILLAITTKAKTVFSDQTAISGVIHFLSDPAIVMIFSVVVATFTLGLNMGLSMKKVMDIYSEAVKDIAMLLLIMGGAGALKQILIDSGVSNEIGELLNGMPIHPLILGWSIACVIRVCVGSATVAGLTAAGIVAPLLHQPGVDPNLMVLAIGAGSLMFSHVNDAGFWLFKEYFNLGIKDTLRSWSLMETIVAVAGIIGVMIINTFVA